VLYVALHRFSSLRSSFHFRCIGPTSRNRLSAERSFAKSRAKSRPEFFSASGTVGSEHFAFGS
jgi:hypothetical protein